MSDNVLIVIHSLLVIEIGLNQVCLSKDTLTRRGALQYLSFIFSVLHGMAGRNIFRMNFVPPNVARPLYYTVGKMATF